MEKDLEVTKKQIGEGTLPISDYLINSLYINGNITKEDYIEYINNTSFIPNIIENKERLPDFINNKAHRMGEVENKENFKRITLDMFDL